jgi:tetratricopeptide (TPR) repeat protein
VVEEKPDAPEDHRNLGHALATKGAFQEASAHLEKAVRLSGRRDPLALFLLGRVSADLGRRQEAVQYEQEALSLAMRKNNADLVQAISAHLRELLATR